MFAFDVAIATFIIRWLIAGIMYLCGKRCFLIAETLKSKTLKEQTIRAGKVLFLCVLLRILASILDGYLAFSIGIFSNIVNYGLWIWLYIYLVTIHRFLRSERVGEEGREQISNAYENLVVSIQEMKQLKEKIITEG